VDAALLILIFLIAVALLFDFLNGLHDAANSIATIVATRVLPPIYAVAGRPSSTSSPSCSSACMWPIRSGKGIIDPGIISDQVIFGALMGAISWNVITWLAGIPSSSSHALIGGLLGAGVAKAGTGAIVVAGVTKTVAAIFLSPAVGFALALLLVFLVSWIFVKANPSSADKIFRKLQFVSASPIRWGTAAMTRRRPWASSPSCSVARPAGTEFHVPFWVVITCQAAIALGTLFGGWRIVHTMGSRITRLSRNRASAPRRAGPSPCSWPPAWAFRSRPPTPSPAPSSAWARRVGLSAVRWNVARSIVWAWFITMPAAAAIGAVFYWLARLAERMFG
jgi:PiT family inorganic phosphate transporter